MNPPKRNGYITDLSGFRKGRLTVESFAEVSKHHAYWWCKCDCGKTAKVSAANLVRKNGGTSSCGCLRSEVRAKRAQEEAAWNKGRTYPIESGERVYKTRHAWAKAVIRHYGNKCERCGWSEARCDAHHRTKRSRGGAHTIKNGIVLCPNHHRIEHEAGGRD